MRRLYKSFNDMMETKQPSLTSVEDLPYYEEKRIPGIRRYSIRNNEPHENYQPNPYQAQPNPYQAQPNPYQAQPNPYQAQPNPYQAQPNPYQTQPNSYQIPTQSNLQSNLQQPLLCDDLHTHISKCKECNRIYNRSNNMLVTIIVCLLLLVIYLLTKLADRC
jgi:hypothetical protein